MNFMFNKIRLAVQRNGIGLTVLQVLRRIVNWLFSVLILQNSKLRLDYTSRVEGLNNIVALGNICAGKHFWLATYEKYYDQTFNPKIIFKGNFSASDFCHIGATNYIEIGNDVLFGSKVYVTDHGHGIYSGNYQTHPDIPPSIRPLDNNKKVVIGDNVWLGDSVVVLPGVTIGKGSVVGSNSVVTKNIPEYSIAVGVPAKVIKKYDFYKNEWIKVV